MATQVLPGLITEDIRIIAQGDWELQISFDLDNHSESFLTIVEHDDVRRVPISKQVAEILIAHGMSYGSLP